MNKFEEGDSVLNTRTNEKAIVKNESMQTANSYKVGIPQKGGVEKIALWKADNMQKVTPSVLKPNIDIKKEKILIQAAARTRRVRILKLKNK
jgi:hypothetical protein